MSESQRVVLASTAAGFKICLAKGGCGKAKPLDEFPHSVQDAVIALCKTCLRAKTRKWKDDRPEELAAQRRRENARRLQRHREIYLRRHYGVDAEWYDGKLAEQGGVCAICGDPPAEGEYLCVDHNHDTNAVRGLLCGGCNTAIGLAREREVVFRGAVTYLMGYGDLK